MAEEIRSLSVKELRLRLDQAGVDHSKCVEKSELVSLVLGIEADHEEKEDSAFSGGHLTTRTGGRSGRSKKNSEKHQKSAEKYKKKKSRKDDSESDSSDEEPSSTDESDSSEEERRRRKQKRKKKKKKKKKAKKKTNKARKRAQEEEDSTDAENHERRPGAAAEEARREGRRASLMGLMATASGSSSPHDAGGGGGGGGGGEEEEEDADGAAESAGLLLQYLPYYGQGDPATDGAVASLLAALPPGGRALRSTVDAAGNTLLLLAAQYAACRALAPGLLAAGADPAARNAEGALALHFACAKETLAPRLARDLVEAGSPVDIAENTYGCTPLHYAAGAGDADLCAFLLAKGASAAVQDHYNYTPLDYAKQSASEECVMLFEDAGGRKGAAGAPVPVNKKASSIVMGGAGNGLMAGNMQKFDLFSDDEESVTTPTKPSSHSLANGRSSTFRFNNAASGGSPKRQLSPGGGGGGGGGGGPSLGGTAKGVSFRGGAAAQGPDALSPTKASMGATLGGPWRAHLDWESGRVYFLNEHDGGSVWEDDLVREARALDDPEHQPSAELKAFLKHHAQRARLLSFLARSEEPWRVAGADALLAEHGGDWGAALAAVAKELGPRGGAAAAEELAPLPANYLRSFRVRHPLVTSKKAFRRGGAARLGGGGGGGVDLGATLSLGGGGGNATLGRRRSSRGLPGGGGGAGLLPDDLLRSGMLPSEAKEGPSQYYGASPTPKLKSNSPAPPKDGSGLTLEVKVSGTLAGGGGGAKGTTPGGGGGGGAGGAGAALPRRPSLRSFGPGDGIASPMGRTRTLSGHMGKTIRISKKGGGALLGGKLTGLELKLHEHFVAKELRALEARHRARRGAAEDAAAAARAERELAAAVQRAEADNLDAEIQRLRKQISELEGELKTKESGFREKEAKVLAEEEAQNGEIASLRRELAAHKEETKKLDAELDQYRDRDSEKIAAEQKEAQDYENELSSKMKFSQETIQKAKNDREGEFRALSQKLGKELREVGQLLEHEASELRGRLQAARAKGAEDASRAKSEAEAAQRRAAQARQQTETLEAQAKATREEIEAAESMRGRMSQLAALLNAQAELRKKLHNRIEDLKGKIRVYVRVRPLSKKELKNKCENVASKEGQHTIKVVDEKSGEKHWDFDQVFAGNPGPPDGNSQEAIFRDTKYLITSAVDGYNVCIFAYGQTGSGKTFTMFGPGGAGDGVSPTGEVDELAGLTPRCVVELFRILEERRAQYDYSLTVSMYELYRDGLRDLLNHRGKQRLNIKLAEHTGNGLVHVEGGAERPAADLPAVLEVIREGAAHRATSSTQMNADSSRSHLVCMLVIKSTNRRRGTEVLGKLTMVDLAGSERVGRSGATGDQLKEAQSINKSLSALGDVIGALTTGSKHVPYRNHPLTMLMSDSLGGNAKTLMFVCASPADYNAAETGNALNFAARCKDVTNAVAGGAGAQQAQIQALRRQLEKMGGGGKKGAAPAKLARPT